jgi:hypothetical protein
MYEGTLYVATRGWYEVGDETARKLEKLHADDNDPDSPRLFDVATREEAQRMEEEEAERIERASAAKPNKRAAVAGRVEGGYRGMALPISRPTEPGTSGGDLASHELTGTAKTIAMLDPDPDGAELDPDGSGDPENEGIANVGRVFEHQPSGDKGGRRRTSATTPVQTDTSPKPQVETRLRDEVKPHVETKPHAESKPRSEVPPSKR